MRYFISVILIATLIIVRFPNVEAHQGNAQSIDDAQLLPESLTTSLNVVSGQMRTDNDILLRLRRPADTSNAKVSFEVFENLDEDFWNDQEGAFVGFKKALGKISEDHPVQTFGKRGYIKYRNSRSIEMLIPSEEMDIFVTEATQYGIVFSHPDTWLSIAVKYEGYSPWKETFAMETTLHTPLCIDSGVLGVGMIEIL